MARTKADSLGEEQFGKLGDEEDPATDRRREYIYIRLDLGESEEQVTCHASGLALTIIDEACREAVM